MKWGLILFFNLYLFSLWAENPNYDQLKSDRNLLIGILKSNPTPQEIKKAIESGIDPNQRSDNTYPILLASEKCNDNDIEVIKALIMGGAEVNIIPIPSEGSPLMLAVQGQKKKIVKTLLDAGADPNAKRPETNETALIFASYMNEDIEIIKMLLQAGARINDKDKYGTTALTAAVSRPERVDFVHFLLAAKADIHIRDDKGGSAIFYAASPETLDLLLTAGARINEQNNDGLSPLMIAAKYDREPELIIAIMKYGADLLAEDNAGKTVLDHLDTNKHLKDSPIRKTIKDAMRKMSGGKIP